MTTAMDSPTEPIARESDVIDTGPQAVLELAEQKIPQRDIARMLHISQPTVSRRIREALEARQSQRRQILTAALITWLAVLATILTAAIACLAWG